jgi:hypothetical protein
MQTEVVAWLDRLGSTAFTLSAWGFVILNVAGVAVIAWKRDRVMVNRWTSRFLAANLVLLGTGLGVPVAALALRSAIVTLSPAFSLRASSSDKTSEPRSEAAQSQRNTIRP